MASNLKFLDDGRQERIIAQLHGIDGTVIRCCCNEDEVPQSSIEGSICALVLVVEVADRCVHEAAGGFVLTANEQPPRQTHQVVALFVRQSDAEILQVPAIWWQQSPSAL